MKINKILAGVTFCFVATAAILVSLPNTTNAISLGDILAPGLSGGGGGGSDYESMYNKEIKRITPFIRVVSPKDGTVDASKPLNITWQGTNLSGSAVDITVVNSVSNIPYTIATGTINTGSSTFAIPTRVPGGKYYIKISASASSTVYGVSKKPIKINAAASTQASITITKQPQTTIALGGVATTSWISTGNIPNVKISLVSTNSVTVLEKKTKNTGLYSFTINKKQPSGLYWLKIGDADNENFLAATTTPFTITNPSVALTVPVISKVSPSSAATGTPVTIIGKGFDLTSNFVLLDGWVASGIVSSANNTSLTFTLPNNLYANCNIFVLQGGCPTNYPPVTVGDHLLSVMTENGTSTSVKFTVIPNTVAKSQTVSITKITPTSGLAGSLVTITGKGFASAGNTVVFADTSINNLSSSDNKTVQFNIPATSTLGVKQIHVTNSIGSSNSSEVTVISTTITSKPSAPKNLKVKTSETCGGKIDLSWNKVDGASSYNVYRLSGSMYIKVQSGLTATNFSEIVLPGTTFKYKITAVNGVNESDQSNDDSGKSSKACTTSSSEPSTQSASSIGAIKNIWSNISSFVGLKK